MPTRVQLTVGSLIQANTTLDIELLKVVRALNQLELKPLSDVYFGIRNFSLLVLFSWSDSVGHHLRTEVFSSILYGRHHKQQKNQTAEA